MKSPFHLMAAAIALLGLTNISCERKAEAISDRTTGPAPATVEREMDANRITVEHAERFAVVTAGAHVAAPEMNVNGVVSPDVSRQMPVPSLATGRVIEINARLGDQVSKGQVLFKVRSTDVAGAYSDYRKAVKNQQLAEENERLAKTQQERAKILFDNGSIPKSALEVANNNEIAAATAVDNARVDVETATERLKLLGSDPEHPSGIIEVRAPAAGVITDQQITDQSGVQALTPPNPFTISDMSHVWIVCDVYENNLAQVKVGEYADIHVTAYPNRVLRARISNIAPVLDPNLRTAKVRLEVDNPGFLRFGMFVSATFHGEAAEKRAMVPAAAILHLHDRDWVYMPTGPDTFRRVEVTAGGTLPNNMQEVINGIKPGDQVVAQALVLQSTVEQ